MADKRTAAFYRARVHWIWWRPPEDMDEFHRLIESTYQESVNVLLDADPATDNYKSVFRQYSPAIFLTATGLFAFGHFDVFPDILDHIPLPPESMPLVYFMVSVLTELTPYPNKPNFIDRPDEIRQWLEQHRDQLCWSEDAGRFVFRSDIDGIGSQS